jgi:hypothetical protein
VETTAAELRTAAAEAAQTATTPATAAEEKKTL